MNRPTVMLAAQDLAARGLIEYFRGTIRVLDRAGPVRAKENPPASVELELGNAKEDVHNTYRLCENPAGSSDR